MPGGLDVVLHVADEDCFPRRHLILFKDLVNFGPLVVDAEIGPLQEVVETVAGSLRCEMSRVDGAEKKCSQPAFPAKEEEVSRMGQFHNRILHLPKMAMEPRLQLRQRH